MSHSRVWAGTAIGSSITHNVAEPETEPSLLLLDGRLDNRDELIRRYRTPLRGATDHASLVLAAYQQDAIAGLGRLVGDWSVVISDRRAGLTILASDFAGVRPLYYRIDGGRITWSTRASALLDAGSMTRLDERFIAGFLMFGGYPNRTTDEGVRSVPPGHAVCVGSNGVRTISFWTPPTGERCRYADERQYDEHFAQLFREAVAVRLTDSRPAIAELSGGLDSSSVVCMAHELIRTGAVAARGLRSVSYVHSGSTDLSFIQAVERHCEMQGVHVSLDERPLFAAGHRVGALPHTTAPLHEAAVTVAEAEGATTFLTGQAGDLVLGNWIDDSLQVAAAIRGGRPGQAVAEALAWSRVTRMPALTIVGRALLAMLPEWRSRGIDHFARMTQSPVQSFVQSAFLRRVGLTDGGSVFVNEWGAAPIERRMHFQAFAMMRQLRALEPLEAMHGLCYTHPFAHRPLVEFLMKLPAEVLCRPGQPRLLMRRALAALWPAALRLRRSKSLFGGQYLDAFRPFVLRLLRERSWHVVERGWIDRRRLAAALERVAARLDCPQPLRNILLLENWLRQRQLVPQPCQP